MYFASALPLVPCLCCRPPSASRRPRQVASEVLRSKAASAKLHQGTHTGQQIGNLPGIKADYTLEISGFTPFQSLGGTVGDRVQVPVQSLIRQSIHRYCYGSTRTYMWAIDAIDPHPNSQVFRICD